MYSKRRRLCLGASFILSIGHAVMAYEDVCNEYNKFPILVGGSNVDYSFIDSAYNRRQKAWQFTACLGILMKIRMVTEIPRLSPCFEDRT